LDSGFSSVPERRVAKIVNQPASRRDGLNLAILVSCEMPLALEPAADLASDAPRYASYFERVSQPIANAVMGFQWKNLRFVLQAFQWAAKDNPVLIAFELISMIPLAGGGSASATVEQLVPIHR
jgi:hypothetical protein